jgi:hypothetical protein
MKTLANRKHGQVRIVILALVCFSLGVAVSGIWFSRRPQIEAVSPLVQQEQASRSLAVDPSVPVSAPPQPSAPIDPAAVEAVKRAIPNVTLVSTEQATLILRKTAVAELQKAVQELQARQKKAQQTFIERQGSQSTEQQIIAAKELQQFQAEQMEKLKEIAASSQAQIDALKQLKGQSQ